MRQLTLSGVVKRRFVHLARQHPVQQVVAQIGIDPGILCRIIAGKPLDPVPVAALYRIAQWLRMPVVNVFALAGVRPTIRDFVRAGMELRGYRVTSSQDQMAAAAEAGISVAVFRRALHGYASFSPSIKTCEQLTAWLGWSGLDVDQVANAAGMIIHYHADGGRTILARAAYNAIQPYPCACGRPGCMIPAHIPAGPRRKWRSDACRMWAKRRQPLPAYSPISHFISINERFLPVRF